MPVTHRQTDRQRLSRHERRMTTTASKGSKHRTTNLRLFCPSLRPLRFGTKPHFVPSSPIISQLIGRRTRKRRTSSSSMDRERGGERATKGRHKSLPAFFDERGTLSPSTKKWVRFSINQARTQRLMRLRSYFEHGAPKMVVGCRIILKHCRQLLVRTSVDKVHPASACSPH